MNCIQGCVNALKRCTGEGTYRRFDNNARSPHYEPDLDARDVPPPGRGGARAASEADPVLLRAEEKLRWLRNDIAELVAESKFLQLGSRSSQGDVSRGAWAALLGRVTHLQGSVDEIQFDAARSPQPSYARLIAERRQLTREAETLEGDIGRQIRGIDARQQQQQPQQQPQPPSFQRQPSAKRASGKYTEKASLSVLLGGEGPGAAIRLLRAEALLWTWESGSELLSRQELEQQEAQPRTPRARATRLFYDCAYPPISEVEVVVIS